MMIRRRLIRRHVVPQAIKPVLILLGIEFGYLFGGAVLVESVFGRDGLGSFLTNAVAQKDAEGHRVRRGRGYCDRADRGAHKPVRRLGPDGPRASGPRWRRSTSVMCPACGGSRRYAAGYGIPIVLKTHEEMTTFELLARRSAPSGALGKRGRGRCPEWCAGTRSPGEFRGGGWTSLLLRFVGHRSRDAFRRSQPVPPSGILRPVLGWPSPRRSSNSRMTAGSTLRSDDSSLSSVSARRGSGRACGQC